MPTYAFTSAKEITAPQRQRLVESVTIIHEVEATAPRYFVQVVFYKVDPGTIFVGGETASPITFGFEPISGLEDRTNKKQKCSAA